MRKLCTKRNQLKGVEAQKLTVRNIAARLLKIMESHISMDDGITRPKLFRKIFKKSEDESLADMVRWDYVRKAMKFCRQNTQCFIGSDMDDSKTWYFYVITDHIEASIYNTLLRKEINGMKRMQKRALKAVKEEWYREDWEMPPLRITKQ
jgi:hypothetical protein